MMNNTPKQLYIATKNKSKFESLKRAVNIFDREILIADIFKGSIPKHEENGFNSLENAIIKARFYFHLLSENVLAEDDAIYFDGMPESGQPGSLVKRMVKENNPSIFWTEFIKINKIKAGKIEKNFCLINKYGLEKTATVLIPFKITIPKAITGGSNPLNDFMIPEGFRTSFRSLTSLQNLEITKKFILPKLSLLLDYIM